jgi:hypothetical protein
VLKYAEKIPPVDKTVDKEKRAHVYEVRPRKDQRGFDLISDQLPFGRLCYVAITHAVDYAKFYSRSHPVTILVFDEFGLLVETHEHSGDFREP